METAGRASPDRLAVAELGAFLGEHAGKVDLLAAADVLNYCGALEPVMTAAARVLSPGGLFAFSLESHEGPEPVLLRPSLRYAHELAAARIAILSAGFDLVRFETSVLRFDRGEPVVGCIVLCVRNDATTLDGATQDAALPVATTQLLN